MKTTIKKDFDSVKFMRQERDRISREISDMTHEQIKEYFAKKRSRERIPRSDKCFFGKYQNIYFRVGYFNNRSEKGILVMVRPS